MRVQESSPGLPCPFLENANSTRMNFHIALRYSRLVIGPWNHFCTPLILFVRDSHLPTTIASFIIPICFQSKWCLVSEPFQPITFTAKYWCSSFFFIMNDNETMTVVEKPKPIKKLKPARKQVKAGEVERKETPQTGKEYSKHQRVCCAGFLTNTLLDIWYNKWAGGDREDNYSK
jgi:hypothetical protein